ncbi:starch phosphorylase [Microlunatus sagamiharensis]|uniref:glycogen phosphorylase n=1 Tax=Microlunatus sagamiharensis TaxID=546874 RepID=A0A1H2M8T0_9ACTN|nr:alpha-glucan family phosphorylase [Microlunatus sagamiharensis]SDU89524.1 starch phosphorylase [Microlunatus sagamiharensis]
MRAIRRFTVRPVLPDVLKGLGDLAKNLRWCWNTETADLFRSVDPDLWETSGHDPVRLLADVSVERLDQLTRDKRFLKNLRGVEADLADYLSGDLWYSGYAAENESAPRGIAYFSPEFGITEVLPQYSGGLGILAGDHLKSASDLGVPIIGVGLLYRQGYFRQSLNAAGWQQETYPLLDPNALPLTLLHDDAGPVTVEVGLGGGRVLHAQVWLAQVGRVPLLLLDSDVESNAGPERETTDRLYGGGTEHRLAQETLLGIGGVRAVRAYCKLTGIPAPEVYHTNEGHAGFQGLERIREQTIAGVDFDTALESARAGTVFTTHTPVPAGIDRFPVDLVRHQFADFGLPLDRVLSLGTEDYDGGDRGVFNMAVMGFRLGQRANGVSLLHGEVSREMFQGLWNSFDTSEVPISSITNGVHHLTWVHRDLLALLEAPSGSTGDSVVDGYDWNALAGVEDKTIWDLKRTMRSDLIAFTRRRLAESSANRGLGTDWVSNVLDPDTITFGFARRVPSYKRLTLMLREPERLRALLTDPERPIQIVIAGKSHPADEGGKALIQQMVQFADAHDVRERIVFLPDYDIGMAKPLYPGCDVWMNNPLRPYEACGTSGMKAALNGAANLSILDGWWDEWYDPAFGWEIPSAEGVSGDQRDDLEARSLYDIIENEIVPRFYDHDSKGVPRRWVQMFRETVAGLGPKVLASRMVRDYVTHLYAPSAASSRALEAETGGPEALAEWKRKVRDAWGGVVVDHVQSLEGEQVEVNTPIHVSALVDLGALSPEDVEVQLVTGRVGSDDQLREPRINPFPEGTEVDGGLRRYEGTVQARRAGSIGYTVRVVPHHPLLASTAEMGLAALPTGLSSPPSA